MHNELVSLVGFCWSGVVGRSVPEGPGPLFSPSPPLVIAHLGGNGIIETGSQPADQMTMETAV